MNKKTNLSHKAIKLLLNTSLVRLGQPALTRLRDARAQALVHHDTHHGARHVAPAFAWAGNNTWQAAGMQHKSRILAATVLVIALLFSISAYWQQATENDVAEVDLSILTDDLPMHVYLD